jgi:hypothetical protein
MTTTTEVLPRNTSPFYAVPLHPDAFRYDAIRLSDDLWEQASSSDYTEWLAENDPQPTSKAAAVLTGPRVVNANELRDTVPVPLEWAWPGFIAKRSSTLVVRVAESYKSWVCLYLAMCWAIGRVPFSDARTTAAKVLYVAGETRVMDGVEHRRFRALQTGHSLSEDFTNLNFVEARGLSLKDTSWLPRLLKQHQPDYIFFDSAAALAGLEDENANSLVREFLRSQVDSMLSEYPNLTFVGIHHSGKSPLGKDGKLMPVPDERVARGASGWRDGVDSLVYLRAASREDGRIVIRSSKTREGCRPEPLYVRLNADADPLTTARLVVETQAINPTSKATVQGLLGPTPQTLDQLAKASGLPRATVQRALGELANSAARTGKGVNGDPYRYSVSVEGLADRPNGELSEPAKCQPI